MLAFVLFCSFVYPCIVGGYPANLESYSIYTGGTIYTVEGDDWNIHPAHAMVVNDWTGDIEYVGSNVPDWFYEQGTIWNLIYG